MTPTTKFTTANGAKVRVVSRTRHYSLAGARGGKIRHEAIEYRVTVQNGRATRTLFERFFTEEAAVAFVRTTFGVQS